MNAALPGLPFARLNLRRNPFGELDHGERTPLVVVDVGKLPERLARPGLAVQLLGGSGRGKTSHMLALHDHFPGAPWLLALAGRRVPIPPGSPLFLDDAHLLPRWRRRLLFRRPRRSFVLATHEDLGAELARAGLDVVTIRPAERLDVPSLLRIAQLRVEAARRTPGPLPRVSRPAAERLLARHGNDVRAIERELYQAFQRLEEVADVEV